MLSYNQHKWIVLALQGVWSWTNKGYLFKYQQMPLHAPMSHDILWLLSMHFCCMTGKWHHYWFWSLYIKCRPTKSKHTTDCDQMIMVACLYMIVIALVMQFQTIFIHVSFSYEAWIRRWPNEPLINNMWWPSDHGCPLD